MAKQKRPLLKEHQECVDAIREWKRLQLAQWNDTQRNIQLWDLRRQMIELELEERFGEEGAAYGA